MLDHGELYAMGAPHDVVREMRYVLLRSDPNFVPEQGTREVELAAVELIREDGSTAGPVRAGEALDDPGRREGEPAGDDLVASFQVLDSANYPIVDGREPIGSDRGQEADPVRDPRARARARPVLGDARSGVR